MTFEEELSWIFSLNKDEISTVNKIELPYGSYDMSQSHFVCDGILRLHNSSSYFPHLLVESANIIEFDVEAPLRIKRLTVDGVYVLRNISKHPIHIELLEYTSHVIPYEEVKRIGKLVDLNLYGHAIKLRKSLTKKSMKDMAVHYKLDSGDIWIF